jgi:biopolymer transport protein ExbB/TolQ
MAEPTHDLSMLGLFLSADPVVKGVILVLLLASFAVWTVAIDRTVRLARLRREAEALDAAARGGPAPRPGGLADAVLRAGEAAARPAEPGEPPHERRERAREAMRLALADGLRPLEPGLPLLATVGSAAPFVGLFGTVWGIMGSFGAIAASNDTSLAVVAPGIAEALFATAVGLVAAIPAVLAYNRLVTGLGRVRAACLGAVTRLARDLPAAAAPAAARLAAE